MRKATLVLPILLLFALSAPARDKYKVTRLGTLGGSFTDVLAINSFGQIRATLPSLEIPLYMPSCTPQDG